jgi:NTP pyrophosphatase (non-canonical NTP hydrolase)
MAIGLSTEANEVLDAYKKAFAYGKKLDVVNVGEELGDILWYMANLMRMLDIDFESVLQINVDKLKARYPDKFDSDKAITRDLGKERAILEQLGYNSALD